jgi:LuxR family transcriptional regulator, quorum-sensing system regulator LasR
MEDELFSLLERIATPEHIAHACLALCRELGFDYYLFNLCVPQRSGKPVGLVLSSLPESWQQHYHACGYEKIDPVVERARCSVVPFFWEEIARDTSARRGFFEDARRFGIQWGLTCPLAGPLNSTGLLSLMRHSPAEQERHGRRALVSKAMAFAAYLHEATRTMLSGSDERRVANESLLTRRERECLALSASGYTTSEIAESLSIKPRTVAFHIDRSVVKLGVRSRRAAVTRALLLGEITPHSLWQTLEHRVPIGPYYHRL